MDKEDDLHAKLSHDHDLRIVVGSDFCGETSDSEGGSQSASVVPDVDGSASLTGSLQDFDHRVAKISSAVLLLVVYVTNWYSAYRGHPQYVPDWAIGGVLYGFSMDWYKWIKAKATIGNGLARGGK